MLDGLKRLFAGRSAGPDWGDVAAWAKAAGHGFKRVREGNGFVVEARDWRLEAGPSQRQYIEGPELRLRRDVELPPDLQMLVISRELMRALESETFLQYTDSLKTYADDSAPEEMRWLAMFTKLGADALGPLGTRFGALALVPATVQAWLGGALSAKLNALAISPEQPLVLMVNRGRVTLRTECEALGGDAFAQWIALFETALAALPDAVQAMRKAPA